MSRPVKLYHLQLSSNSIKVRCALAYKKIPYEKVAVDPHSREAVVAISGQPLTPVLLHGDTVVYDSYAILRYLDGNWPGEPRLFSADRDTIKKIEEWEQFGRTDVGPAISLGFGQMRAATVDPEKIKKANDMLNRAASRIEETLSTSPYLLGDAPTAADFTVATMLYYGLVPENAAQSSPGAAFFKKHFALQGAPKTAAWIGRIMEWDR